MKSIYLTSLQTKSIKQYNGINNNTIQFIITDVLYMCFQRVKNLAQPYRIHMVVPLDL